ncbi:hypothetical protein CEXT_534321 [Caerostris extrusa]|uniref:Peptidase aspartic putative domain-containing protein n=1 Tax=Caerostris extrusa TaxID=172846 RepID=A0AAV4VEA8_CAEEX|nr:hypothetical protein CEXT_534321 [Caerostris extrusa]
MCPELKQVVSTGSDKLVAKAVENSNEKFHTLANPTCSADALLQTLVVYLYGNDGNFPVRALIDTGNQKSYITKEAVSKMSYEPIRAEDMIHNLFGGVESKAETSFIQSICKAVSKRTITVLSKLMIKRQYVLIYQHRFVDLGLKRLKKKGNIS